jgi:hypothetical protein
MEIQLLVSRSQKEPYTGAEGPQWWLNQHRTRESRTFAEYLVPPTRTSTGQLQSKLELKGHSMNICRDEFQRTGQGNQRHAQLKPFVTTTTLLLLLNSLLTSPLENHQ